MPIADVFLQNIGLPFNDSPTYESAADTARRIHDGDITANFATKNTACPTPTSCAEDSPARTSATPESAPESTEIAADCGASMRESFANYDPATSSWRTSQRSFFEEWSEFSETWPRAGMTRSGKAYELPTLARRTEEIESGLWPTPQAHDIGKRGNTEADHHYYPHDLANAVEMFPTPRVCAGLRSSGMNRTEFYRKFWPTPTAEDSQCKGNHPGAMDSLHAAVKEWPTPTGQRRTGLQSHGKNAILGQLNPTWTELLMGFPPGWTDLT